MQIVDDFGFINLNKKCLKKNTIVDRSSLCNPEFLPSFVDVGDKFDDAGWLHNSVPEFLNEPKTNFDPRIFCKVKHSHASTTSCNQGACNQGFLTLITIA